MKKILILAVCGAFAVIAKADYLYWMVADDYVNTAESAQLVAVSGDTTHAFTPAKTKSDWMSMAEDESFETNIAGYSGDGWSYYVEIVNAGKTLQSDSVTYADAVRNGYVQVGPLGPAATLSSGPLGGGSQTYNVPEPTSGLLFLVGGMLLGLRRKRRV